jgi:hypothetical protein
MKLKNVAKMFDTCPVYDGYAPTTFLWKCQFSSFNDTNAVGSTSTRRVLSIAPGLRLPERRVIKVFEDRWIIGDGNPDEWRGEVIRQSFNMKKATDLSAILTPAQACLATVGTPAYSQKIYLKDTVNNLNDADYDLFWNVYFSPTEPMARGYFVRNGSTLLRVRNHYLPLEGLRIAQCDEIDSGPHSVTFQTGTINPVTEVRASAPVAGVALIMLDFTKAYAYQTQADPRVATGDMAAIVAASQITPKVDDRFTLAGREWRVLNTEAQHDAWLLHVRRA